MTVKLVGALMGAIFGKSLPKEGKKGLKGVKTGNRQVSKFSIQKATEITH